jgi:type I restriction enzyme, S subunit
MTVEPVGWTRTALGEITALKVDQSGPDANCSDFTYVDIGSLDGTTKTIAVHRLLATKDAPSRARQRLRANDVIVSMTRPNLNGVACVSAEFNDAVCSTAFHVLRATGVEPGYLFAAVRSKMFVTAMTETVQGALYPAIRPDDVRLFEIPLAPLNEQRRIVAKLDAIFEQTRAARARLERLPALLEKLKRSILAGALCGDLTKDWRAARPNVEPAGALLDRIRLVRRRSWEDGLRLRGKDPRKLCYEEPSSPSPEGLEVLPDGWAWTTIDCVTVDSLYGPRFGSEQYADHGVPTIRTTDLGFDGRIRLKDPPRIAEAHANLADWGLRDGDLLVTRTGATIGKSAVYSEYIGPALPSAYLIRFRPILSELGRWLHLFLSSPRGQQQLGLGTTATAQPNVNARTIGAFLLPIAPLGEQRRILAVVQEAFGTAEAVEERVHSSSERLDRIEQAALAKAFRGELVPQDPTDEPASVLLERIRAARAAEPSAPRRGRASPAPPAAPTNGHATAAGEEPLDLVIAAFQQGAPRIAATAIAEATGLDAAAVKRALSTLVDSGQVRVHGRARGTTYGWAT